jgi:light-regulated signal transduction histidine kinase (bacteriophytochrome)
MHTYGRYGRRVSFPVRQLCKLLGQSISRNIERLSMSRRLQARKLINTSATEANPSGYIIAKAEDLLDLFSADSGILSIGDEAKVRSTSILTC